MRVKWRRVEANGAILEGVRDLDKQPLADALMTVITFWNLKALKITYNDGSSTTYQAPEYECTACGSYDHPDGDCICDNCDDWDNIAHEDHPYRCEVCGKEWD